MNRNSEQLDVIASKQTSAGVGFLAGIASTLAVQDIQGIPHLLNPITGEAKSLVDLLPAPIRQQTSRTLFTVEAFNEYVKRFAKKESTIYVTGSASAGFDIVCLIDHRGPDATAWLDHSVTLKLERSEALRSWLEQNKRRLSQEDFADLLEERYRDIVSPSAADIIEIARDLQVTRNLSVKSCIRKDGNNAISFNNDEKLKGGAGEVDLPTEFKINVEPFARHREKAEIRALLRPRIVEERPTFIYDLQLVDEAVEEVLTQVVSAIRTQTALPVYR